MKGMPTILIIFGVSGDLSRRYLLPAIEGIASAGMMPTSFHVVGITRQSDMHIESLIEKITEKKYVRDHTHVRHMDVLDINEYKKLGEYLKEIEATFGAPAQRLFYLSVPPSAAGPIAELLGKSGLSLVKETKLLLEKPFGINLKTAEDMSKHIDAYFSPEQVYRVDHYMAKQVARSIIPFREHNSFFKKRWNKHFIESIQVVASEQIGIEGRAGFYDKTGALRDYVPSHLLGLAALVLMDPPGAREEVPDLRERALKNLNVARDMDKNMRVKRAQYEGYLDEVENPKSMTETFVSLTLESKDPNWIGVPIMLTTGKALSERLAAIRISFKKDDGPDGNKAHELILRIQPNPGIEFGIRLETPDTEKLPEAYEQVLFNAMQGEKILFISNREILEYWRILDEIQKAWENSKEKIAIYKKGSSAKEVLDILNKY